MLIGERIKMVRLYFDLNQADFGNKISVGQAYESQIEKGDRDATDKIVKLICYEFGVSETWLRTGEGSMFSSAADDPVARLATEKNMTSMEETILREYLMLPMQYREVIRDAILRMAAAISAAPETEQPQSADAVRVFRAARSNDNTESGYVEIPRSTLDKLKEAPVTDEI